jgi:hypothetical protein
MAPTHLVAVSMLSINPPIPHNYLPDLASLPCCPSLQLRPKPFKGCTDDRNSNAAVIQALLNLYGVWVDAEDASTATAVTARGRMVDSGDKDVEGEDLLSRVGHRHTRVT